MNNQPFFAALAAAFFLSACTTAPQGGRSAATDAAPHCGAQHFPFHALENEIEGDVILRVEIDRAGQAQSATVRVPSASRYLDSAAVDGVLSCRFASAAAARTLDVRMAYRFRNRSEVPPEGVVTVGLPLPPADAAPPATAPR